MGQRKFFLPEHPLLVGPEEIRYRWLVAWMGGLGSDGSPFVSFFISSSSFFAFSSPSSACSFLLHPLLPLLSLSSIFLLHLCGNGKAFPRPTAQLQCHLIPPPPCVRVSGWGPGTSDICPCRYAPRGTSQILTCAAPHSWILKTLVNKKQLWYHNLQKV